MFDALRGWLADRIAGDIIEQRLASVGVSEVRDQVGWQSLLREVSTEDRLFIDWQQDVADALEAWRKNFMVRQIVRLTTGYVVGDGVGISSELPTVEKFIRQWWGHPQNRMDLRLAAMCDELTRSGELFPVLFSNEYDGMTYIRFVPARQIDQIDTDPDDLEQELRCHRLGTLDDIEGKWWASPETADPGQPVMLHYAVNRPIGAVRGEGDLTPILPWVRRYTAWLKDRVRLNRARVEGGLWDVTIDDDTQLEKKRKQYAGSPPEHGSVIVHGKGEEWAAKSLSIEAADAAPDGKALRLAVATGSGNPLHFFSEGESATKATAAEMGGPTFRHYRRRQQDFCWMLCDIVEHAYRLSGKRRFTDLRLQVTVTDIVPGDNKLMADSAKTIVDALATMRDRGWVTDELAISLAFKFAGEILSMEEVERIMEASDQQENEVRKEEEEGDD